MSTAAHLLLQRAEHDLPAFFVEDRVWSYGDIMSEGPAAHR